MVEAVARTATLSPHAFLAALDFSVAPAVQNALDAVGALRSTYAGSSRLLPVDTPTAFVEKRREKLVFTVGGIDVRFYEICAPSELPTWRRLAGASPVFLFSVYRRMPIRARPQTRSNP